MKHETTPLKIEARKFNGTWTLVEYAYSWTGALRFIEGRFGQWRVSPV